LLAIFSKQMQLIFITQMAYIAVRRYYKPYDVNNVRANPSSDVVKDNIDKACNLALVPMMLVPRIILDAPAEEASDLFIKATTTYTTSSLLAVIKFYSTSALLSIASPILQPKSFGSILTVPQAIFIASMLIYHGYIVPALKGVEKEHKKEKEEEDAEYTHVLVSYAKHSIIKLAIPLNTKDYGSGEERTVMWGIASRILGYTCMFAIQNNFQAEGWKGFCISNSAFMAYKCIKAIIEPNTDASLEASDYYYNKLSIITDGFIKSTLHKLHKGCVGPYLNADYVILTPLEDVSYKVFVYPALQACVEHIKHNIELLCFVLLQYNLLQ